MSQPYQSKQHKRSRFPPHLHFRVRVGPRVKENPGHRFVVVTRSEMERPVFLLRRAPPRQHPIYVMGRIPTHCASSMFHAFFCMGNSSLWIRTYFPNQLHTLHVSVSANRLSLRERENLSTTLRLKLATGHSQPRECGTSPGKLGISVPWLCKVLI